MPFGVSGLKKTFAGIAALVAASVAIVSCGSGNGSSANQHKPSGLPFRAFVSNPLFASGATTAPVLNIVNASLDKLSTSTVSLLATATQPQLMALSPDLSRTLVFSPAGNAIAVIDNANEAVATSNGTTPVPAISLPGPTESIFVAKDNVTAYAAIPSAQTNDQAPGAVLQLDTTTGGIEATIPVAGAHFIVPSPDGNHVLVFSDNSDSITDIAVVSIGSNEDPRTTITGFDRPVWAIFNNGGTAYVFNCGAECGGTSAGIATYTIGSSGPSLTTPVSAATYGILNGNLMYVAGTPPHTACGAGTAATTCGTLTILNVNSMGVVGGPIIITDGYHDRMQMGSNGQLFVGSHSCTDINILGGEVRGCLSIFNTTNSKVVVPPQIGDATGIQPIPGRNVVYVCEGGAFQIFDTTTDKLLVQTITTDIIGQSYDVKLVDPPQSQ